MSSKLRSYGLIFSEKIGFIFFSKFMRAFSFAEKDEST